MKLHEYLKQFEGLDPNLEVYKYNPPAEGWESETEYPEATDDLEQWFSIVYTDTVGKKDIFYSEDSKFPNDVPIILV